MVVAVHQRKEVPRVENEDGNRQVPGRLKTVQVDDIVHGHVLSVAHSVLGQRKLANVQGAKKKQLTTGRDLATSSSVTGF